MSLNLFPARIAIGQFQDANGKPIKVYQTVEFARALSDLFERVGGAEGASVDELALLSLPSAGVGDAGGMMAIEQSLLAQQVAELQNQLAAMEGLAGTVAQLQQYVEGVHLEATYRDPFRLDLTRPGPIGSGGASSAAFTTISATGQITSTLAAGTAPFVIASTTKVANLNADLLDGTDWTAPGTIGGTTPGSARFTTVDLTYSVGPAASVALKLFDATGNYGFGMGPTNTEGFINYSSGTASTAVFGHRWYVNGVEVAKVDGTGLFTMKTLKTLGGATFHTTSSALTNGAGVALGTLATAPAAGNPTKWIGIDDNGTVRYIPAW